MESVFSLFLSGICAWSTLSLSLLILLLLIPWLAGAVGSFLTH